MDEIALSISVKSEAPHAIITGLFLLAIYSIISIQVMSPEPIL